MGLERLAMKLYEIPDIRLFWSNDRGVTHQFEVDDPYTPIIYKVNTKKLMYRLALGISSKCISIFLREMISAKPYTSECWKVTFIKMEKKMLLQKHNFRPFTPIGFLSYYWEIATVKSFSYNARCT